MKITISKHFFPLLDESARYLIMCGGRGSGKSEFAARKIFYRCMKEGGHRFLILRKVRKTLQESCVEVMRRVLVENDVLHDYNKTDRSITFVNPSGRYNEILFDGLDEREKIKSYKAATSIWMEELTEFTKDDFMEIDLILREPTPHYKQIMATFNPDEARAPWIKQEFFDKKHPDSFVHVSTVEDNPIKEVREQYLSILESIDDETYRDIYRFGLWAFAKGQIFNWDVVPLPDMKFDEIFYGGDFGYTVNPSVLVKVYRKGDDFWLEELLYKRGLTNQALAAEMSELGVRPFEPVYFDAAEPKSIDEIAEHGFNVHPAQKGPDSVRAGIAFLQAKRITVVEGSTNIIKEASGYKWREDKNGNPLPEPVKFNDHCFVAGTLVDTKRGLVPIEEITTDDYTLTRRGYRRVVASGMTNPSARVMTARFSNGSSLTGTPNHPIWIRGRGYIRLDTMRYGDIIETCQTNALSTKGFRTEGIHSQALFPTDHTTALAGIQSTEQGICTGRYGRTLTATFRRGIMSTTRMAIRRIMLSAISNCAMAASIALNKFSIARPTWLIWQTSGPWPLRGIALRLVENGTPNTREKRTRSAFRVKRSATNAGRPSRISADESATGSAPTSASRRGAGRKGWITLPSSAKTAESRLAATNTSAEGSAPAVALLSIASEPNPQPVFNLTVEDTPEFYANGVLVHNCMDAVRYGIFTHMKQPGVGVAVATWDVRPD